MNLRATYFEQLESILAELASLIKRNEKLEGKQLTLAECKRYEY
jgi:hypothetical protein